MNVEAISIALSAAVGRSSEKFVLVAMASCADAEMKCWPSIQYIAEATAQDRKTVVENIRRLRDSGLISDTGERRGQTKQVVVYALNSPAIGTVKEYRKRTQNKPENGHVTAPGTVPFFPSNSTVFPYSEPEQSRFSLVTVPKTGHGRIEKEKEKEKAVPAPSLATPQMLVEAGFDHQTAEDFIRHKKAIKAPLTMRAWADHLRESKKADWTPQAAAEKVMAKHWRGFEAAYVAGKGGQSTASIFEGSL